jgi:hypothetical protein
MDWSVIIDGFVLLMALVTLAFLVYRVVPAFEYRRRTADGSQEPATRANIGEPPAHRPCMPSREPELLSYRLMHSARQHRSTVIRAMLGQAARFVISRIGSVFRPHAAEHGGALPQPEPFPSPANLGSSFRIIPGMRNEFGLRIAEPSAPEVPASGRPHWRIAAVFLAAGVLASWAAIAFASS